ncbi:MULTISPECIES: 4'-phosphopantetheinyl transferase superfamily protein [Staphylococcus]|uniref:4'-phosphopantetheinyl transferase family protein n=2 Tax=Staphylococcus TaxID=1279 RepID=UPI001F01BE45|nr:MULTISPECIES: 4'-phosphopantetheinyl transferase superfamily protein [Staphylococcus]MDU6091243.1 4'-phosphopantetheinyl transferase superfamily protein [Staphylococcus lugdunensis]
MKYKIYELNDNMHNLSQRLMQHLLNGYSVIVIGRTDRVNKCGNQSSFLTKSQLAKLKNLKRKSDKVNYIYSHALVNLFYQYLLTCELTDLVYQYTSYKKPYIENAYNIRFNISHTEGCCVVAFSMVDIGVDVENITRQIDFKDIIDCYFNVHEALYISDNPYHFFQCWVAKEAYLKCIGTGLMEGLDYVEVQKRSGNHFIIYNNKDTTKSIVRMEDIDSKFILGISMMEVPK